MKTISLEQAFNILNTCAAIVVDDNPASLLYPSMAELNGDPENEFMLVVWEDEGLEYSTKFREGENQTVQVNGGSMWLTDYEGEECHISILVPAKLD